MLKLKYTKTAIKDLNDGYDYIYHENPVAARTVINRIELTVKKLQSQPFMGHKGRVEDTYEFFIMGTPFVIVYSFDSEKLVILTIMHTSRKYP